MANFKFSELPAGTAVALTDLLALSQEMAGTPVSRKLTVAQLIALLAATPGLADVFVNVAGDTMTGGLTISSGNITLGAGNADVTGSVIVRNGANTLTVSVAPDGTVNIEPANGNEIMTINSGTAASGATGQLITGRFRSSMPVEIRNTAATLGSGATGVASALVRASNASSINHTVRKNTGAPGLDFQVGNYFSVTQEGAGQVVLVPENGNVIFHIPSTHLPRTRVQHSTITATLKEVTGSTETWLISGDMAAV
jgi:hypothetical protein